MHKVTGASSVLIWCFSRQNWKEIFIIKSTYTLSEGHLGLTFDLAEALGHDFLLSDMPN